MLLPHGTVVAVVDGDKFDLYRNIGNEGAAELSRMDVPRLDDHNKGSRALHVTSLANPEHRLDEDAHAAAVVGRLNHGATKGEIKHLVVVS